MSLNLDLKELQSQLSDDRYRLLSELGRGGMGLVCAAEDKLLGRKVAIKFISETVSAKTLRRFRRECQLMAKVSSPHVVKVFEWGQTATGLPYIVMELIDGITLEHALESSEGAFGLDDIITVGGDICLALEIVHNLGLVHRDIKPSNIMLLRQEGVLSAKLMDFGIVHDGASAMTLTSDILGSPLYMSPEHLHPKSLDRRSDIFSLGCVLYRCLAGAAPFEAETALLTIVNLEAQRNPLALPSEVKPFMRSIVGKCLEADPNLRFQSARELRDALITRSCKTGPTRTKKPPTLQTRATAAAIFSVSLVLLFSLSGHIFSKVLPSPPSTLNSDEASESWSELEKKALKFQQEANFEEAYKYNGLALKCCNKILERSLIELRHIDLRFALGRSTEADYKWLLANERKFERIDAACSQVKCLKAKLSEKLQLPPEKVRQYYLQALEFYVRSYYDDKNLIFDLQRRMLRFLCRIDAPERKEIFLQLCSTLSDTKSGIKLSSAQLIQTFEPMAAVDPELTETQLKKLFRNYKTTQEQVELLCFMHRLELARRRPNFSYITEAYNKRMLVSAPTRCDILLLMANVYPSKKMEFLEQALDLAHTHKLAAHCRASVNANLTYAYSDKRNFAKADYYRAQTLVDLRARLGEVSEEYQKTEVKNEIARFERIGKTWAPGNGEKK